MRALVTFEVKPTGLVPVMVIQASGNHKPEGRAVPGWQQDMQGLLDRSKRAPDNSETGQPGTFEHEWIDWVQDYYSDGMTCLTAEVKPEPTVDALFQHRVTDGVPVPRQSTPSRTSAPEPVRPRERPT